MATRRLSDVVAMLAKGEAQLSGPYVCIVTNFVSQHRSPRTWTYRGCVFLKGKNWMCQTSIEGKDECAHKPRLPGNHKDFYRFDVFLFDLNFGGMPIRATIFDAARKLLEMSPEEFQLLDDESQKDRLHAATIQHPVFNVWIRTDAEKHCVVQKMEPVISLDSPPASPATPYFTPSGGSRSTTPRNTHRDGLPGTGSSSSTNPITKADIRNQLGLQEGDTDSIPRLVRALKFLNVLNDRDE